MKRLILVVLFILTFVTVCWSAAPVPVKSGLFIELTPTSTDWNAAVQYPDGLQVEAIVFTPGAAGDRLSLKSVSDSGIHIFPWVKSIDGGGITWYYGGQTVKLYLDYSDSTLTDITNTRVLIQLTPRK